MQIDLDPGDYHERKPKGWRWRLPWSHPEDTKLPMVGFFVAAGWLGWAFFQRQSLSAEWLFAGAALWGFIAGGCLVLWLRD